MRFKIKPMQITFHNSSNGTYTIGIQLDWNQATFYYPAIKISTDNVIFQIYPVVNNYDQLDGLLKLGLFKPQSIEQKMALSQYNLRHYSHSNRAEKLLKANHNIAPALEQMADELTEMTDNGIAFR